MADFNCNMSIITLNVNGPNTPIKRNFKSGSKTRPYYILLQETHYICKNTLKVKR